MNSDNTPFDKLVHALKERAKELNCLYQVEELLNQNVIVLEDLFSSLIKVIPTGWQFTEACTVRIMYEDQYYCAPGFKVTPWFQKSDIVIQDQICGKVEVYYQHELPELDEGPFLKEERKLINIIAERIGHSLFHLRMKHLFRDWEQNQYQTDSQKNRESQIIMDLLLKTDQTLFMVVSRKMMNHLCWNGVESAKQLLRNFGSDYMSNENQELNDLNRPKEKKSIHHLIEISDEIFQIAASYLSEREIITLIQKWIQEDKSAFLIKTLENSNSSFNEITDAITRYQHLPKSEATLSPPIEKGAKVSLIRRFFSDQLEFINIAKNYLEVEDFYGMQRRIIYPAGSRGKLGGKSAGLFLAHHILKKNPDFKEMAQSIKVPKTWYITSDGLQNFISYNNLEDVLEQKYKDSDQIRQEYPHIVQTFKNSYFSPEIIKGLSIALDDMRDTPLVIRSSSLLEDRLGAAFSGKYCSLFLANQGSKEQRLESLMDAVAEVYASTFGPDPIEYRTERGLLDFHEEMGVMIQEVVGRRIGNYFLPLYSGVVFSKNEFRWSHRIKRDDGLIRMVAGLGTRAVDRLKDDYPMLMAPGQPNLRVNISLDEIIQYSPKKMDVINLEKNRFETILAEDLIWDNRHNFPNLDLIASILRENGVENISRYLSDFTKSQVVITFEGLMQRTHFVKQVKSILEILQAALKTSVDFEFASDGTDFYLLQCRPQSSISDFMPSSIPQDISEKQIFFTANRYISNGRMPDISHIVYVDPEAYSSLPDLEQLHAVGRAVSRLNVILPKRQFILMGPGRWGSRGDVTLGVNVTYSDINNTAMLIEIARRHGNYQPDLSFGTHFFQDLVESDIRYLPLYPDEEGNILNENFILSATNILSDILPEFAFLAQVIHVVDVPQSKPGEIFRILMNSDLDQAIGFFTSQIRPLETIDGIQEIGEPNRDEHWKWRLRMAQSIAESLDLPRFGIKGIYLIGSTKNAMADASSDIDLLIHFTGSIEQEKQLRLWLEGWDLCLGEMNYLKTGYKVNPMLDVHLITNQDFAKKSSFAAKIDAVTDSARPLRVLP